ncbi:MAG TPA: RMD1 family protein [Polyangia bacterium]|nr:RMD1 family protein [Polyangia bacterium]
MEPLPQTGLVHAFHAVAFVENLSLKDLAAVYPDARRRAHELFYRLDGGAVFIYPFGAVVFRDLPVAARERELERLRRARPGLTAATVIEELTVREDPGRTPDVAEGILTLDQLTPDRASVVALTVAQSAAMEYYERIVEEMFARTEDRLVQRLEKQGTVSVRTRPLHRFIGAAISTRNEVLTILHLLDKPDEAWDDPGMNQIYDELRAEFDLVDRYQALELKLRSVQEALELVLDVARDRRLVLLEEAVVLLILLEIVLTFFRLR